MRAADRGRNRRHHLHRGQDQRAAPAPYSVAKFAFVGFSEGLRAELALEGIPVTTVCPGLRRMGSLRNANFTGRESGNPQVGCHSAVRLCSETKLERGATSQRTTS